MPYNRQHSSGSNIQVGGVSKTYGVTVRHVVYLENEVGW